MEELSWEVKSLHLLLPLDQLLPTN